MNNINIEMLKDKITENKESKKKELAKKLEMLATQVRSKEELEDSQIRNIMQVLLDYRKCCVSFDTIAAATTEDEEERMNLLIQLI